MKPKIPPPIYMIIAGVTMWLLSKTGLDIRFSLPFARAISSGLMTAGAAVAILAAWQFRRARTTIDPLTPSKASSLVTSGVFQFSRNPMYLGMALILLGVALRLGSVLALFVLVGFIALITWVQIKPEEKVLVELFGDSFTDYSANVRRWL